MALSSQAADSFKLVLFYYQQMVPFREVSSPIAASDTVRSCLFVSTNEDLVFQPPDS
jgi:hypothetical protein